MVITKPYNHKLVKREGGFQINLEIHVATHAYITIIITSLKPRDVEMKFYWQIQMFILSLL